VGSNGGRSVKRAVFLDRDGVLNRNVWNAATKEHESPLSPEEFVLLPNVIASLHRLRAAGYLLFLVSNQPNYAKGKASMEVLDAIHHKFDTALNEEGVQFQAFYYCFHHPSFTGPCSCRKPSPHFLLEARDRFAVSLTDSWMIGDRASDIVCGRSAGAKTVWIDDGCRLQTGADYVARDLWSAVEFILQAMY
jgi:D-glycero-D-manno-heptose 1,7-bisphosphate phosphatase